MIVRVPLDGPIHAFALAHAPLPLKNPVRVPLARDGETVGTVVFSVVSPDVNTRASEMCYLLCGAWVQIMGDAVFEGVADTLMQDIIDEVE